MNNTFSSRHFCKIFYKQNKTVASGSAVQYLIATELIELERKLPAEGVRRLK